MSGGGMFIEIFVDAEIATTSIDHNISTIGGGIYAYGNVTLD
jgi:predicted outer membrane repeat protein